MDKHSANLKMSDRVREASDSSTRPSFTAPQTKHTDPVELKDGEEELLFFSDESASMRSSEDAELALEYPCC